MFEERLIFPLNHFEPADTAADVDTDTFGIFFRDFQAGLRHRIVSGGDRHLDKSPHLLDFFFLDELARIENLNLAGNLRIKRSRVERRNAGNAVLTLEQRLPCSFRGVADRGQQTDAGNYNSAGNNCLLPSPLNEVLPRVQTCVSCSPGSLDSVRGITLGPGGNYFFALASI